MEINNTGTVEITGEEKILTEQSFLDKEPKVEYGLTNDSINSSTEKISSDISGDTSNNSPNDSSIDSPSDSRNFNIKYESDQQRTVRINDKLECNSDEFEEIPLKNSSQNGETEEENRYVKDDRCRTEIFSMYLIVVIVIFMLIFLIVIRGFVIPVVNKDWFFPIFLLSIFYILTTILIVGYENHIKTAHTGLRMFLIFYLIAQSILLILIISQFFTHGNVKSTSVMSAVLTIMILIWFLISYNSKIRYTLLVYALIMALFTYLMMTTIKRVD